MIDVIVVTGMITRNMAILSRLGLLSNVQRVVRSASVSVRQVTSVRELLETG